MGVAAVSRSFCGVCGTGHSGLATCPGELRATGAERPGWRVNVETPFGHEAIGVLLAPSHDQWRARIVTYPNVLWSAPGGRGALKFVGNTREEAEAQAIVFVERHVQAKRYLRRDGLAPADVKRPVTSTASDRSLVAVVPRKSRVLPVRFGIDRVIARGITINLSCDGMFVGAGAPVDSGNALLIHLDLNGHTLPLHGLVMWNRWRAEPDRPTGMGIRLSDPPPFYQSFVDRLP
jgi:hypothetical protein